MYWRIRVDDYQFEPKSLVDVCDANAHVIVRHVLPHGNPHYHLWIQSDLTDKALRQRLTRKYNLKASDRSVKICDEDRIDEYVQYLFNTKHGNKWELVAVNNFDTKRLDDCIQRAKLVSEDYSDNKKSKKSNGPTIWELSVEVEQQFQQRFKDEYKVFETNYDQWEWEKSRYEVYTDIAIEVLRKHHKGFCDFFLRKIITTAMSSTENGKRVLRQKMIKHFMTI